MDRVYMSANNITNILSVNVSMGHNMQQSSAIIECEGTNLRIGDSIVINGGYVGNYGKLFTGYVKQITRQEPDRLYTLVCADELVRASDFFIASTNPEAPFTRSNITAEQLVKDVLGLAGISGVQVGSTSFTFAIQNPLEVNLTSSYDYARFIANLVAWQLYADEDGVVHFKDRKPYVESGDNASYTINTGNILFVSRALSDRNLRNRVVVYGADGVYAEASASSPYVPSGFFRTAAVSAPTVFDSVTMAQKAADYNLALYNRLEESVSLNLIGSHNYMPRQVVNLSKSSLDIEGKWYVFSVDHSINSLGYTTNVELRK